MSPYRIPVGQRVVPLPEGDRYLGFIFARGATPGAVEAALARGAALSLLDMVPDISRSVPPGGIEPPSTG